MYHYEDTLVTEKDIIIIIICILSEKIQNQNRPLAITNPMNLVLPVTPVLSGINWYVTAALCIKKNSFHLDAN